MIYLILALVLSFAFAIVAVRLSMGLKRYRSFFGWNKGKSETRSARNYEIPFATMPSTH